MAARPIKVGLEVHQQLATHKLFCNCDSRLVDEVQEEFVRYLQPTQSELGEVDPAAVEEASKGLRFRYQATPTSCLVEADEEPPHAANREAVALALTMALALDATPVDEVHFMRKTVIDGSNTTGFQRSALVARNGRLEVDGAILGVPTICVEEDAARLVERKGQEAVYRLDRLGIPLVEIATTPDIDSPEMARRAALAIGRLLRATRRVLRGLGTIREDLNVSVEGGARVEIKGVQDLRMIATYVEEEVGRQLRLLEAAETLQERGVEELDDPVRDLSDLLADTESGVLQAGLGQGRAVLGLRLPGFAGLLKDRLGPELAAHAIVAGTRGILHSDELPGYGMTEEETGAIAAALGCGEGDAFALVAHREEVARRAMERVRARAAAARRGVPEETRDARPDGTTRYSRPLPGSARMYPETDVPPIPVAEAWLRELAEGVPEPPEVRVTRLSEAFDVHPQQLEQLVDENWDELFEELAREHGNASVVARTFLNTLPELVADGVAVGTLSEEAYHALFAALAEERFAKEAVPDVLRAVADRGLAVEEAVEDLGLRRMTRAELEAKLEALVADHFDLLRERGEDAVKPLMGLAMEEVRGAAEGKTVNEILRALVRARLQDL